MREPAAKQRSEGKIFQGEGGACLLCLRHSKKAGVPGEKQVRQAVIGDDVGEVERDKSFRFFSEWDEKPLDGFE